MNNSIRSVSSVVYLYCTLFLCWLLAGMFYDVYGWHGSTFEYCLYGWLLLSTLIGVVWWHPPKALPSFLILAVGCFGVQAVLGTNIYFSAGIIVLSTLLLIPLIYFVYEGLTQVAGLHWIIAAIVCSYTPFLFYHFYRWTLRQIRA